MLVKFIGPCGRGPWHTAFRVWCVLTSLLIAAPVARALDAGLEEAFLATFPDKDEFGNPIFPETHDADLNGIVDWAHVKFLDEILLNNNAPRHTVILSLYTLNLLQIQIDNTLRPQCPVLEPLLGFKCDDLEKLVAAIFTTGETDAVNRLVAEIRKYGLRVNLADYNLSGNTYLGANGDLDRDGFSNLVEYNAVCKRMDPFIAAAMSRGLTPDTVPCCGDCPILIERQPVSAAKYIEQGHTFSFVAKGGDGPLSYQWRKDGAPIGVNAPSLGLLLLQPADAGEYVCTVTDGVRSATTDTVTLTVAPHLLITSQPAGAARLTGESYTLRVAHTGGLPPISYEWKHDGADVGGNSPELVLSGLALSDAGNYWCRVRDLFETRLSQTAVMVVTEPGEGEGEGEEEGEGEGETECHIDLQLDLPEGITVQVTPGAPYTCGMLLLLTATLDPGFAFLGWNGPVLEPAELETPLLLPVEAGTLTIGVAVERTGEGEGEGEGEEEGEGEGDEEGEDELQGDLRVSAEAAKGLDFQYVRVGESADITFEFINVGLAPVTVSGAFFLGEVFETGDMLDFTLASVERRPVTVRFTPVDKGVYTDVLILDTSLGRRYVHMIGRGGMKPLLACGVVNEAGAGSRAGDALVVVAMLAVCALSLHRARRKPAHA